MFVFAFLTPVVFGGPHSDYIYVTFTPTGDISLDVYPGTASFGSVPAGTVNATPSQGSSTSTYTLKNNGSVAAHVYIFSNATTNTSEWTLDNDGQPADDHFCLKRWNSTGGGFVYIRNTNTSWIPNLAAAGGTRLFGLSLQLGNVTSGDKLDAQSTRINITGTAV
ncbi:MAG: hypothetical protein ACQXXD_06950 [Thermoplasmatota archaeon]